MVPADQTCAPSREQRAAAPPRSRRGGRGRPVTLPFGRDRRKPEPFRESGRGPHHWRHGRPAPVTDDHDCVLAMLPEASVSRSPIDALGVRPEQSSRRRRPNCLLAHRSESASRGRELLARGSRCSPARRPKRAGSGCCAALSRMCAWTARRPLSSARRHAPRPRCCETGEERLDQCRELARQLERDLVAGVEYSEARVRQRGDDRVPQELRREHRVADATHDERRRRDRTGAVGALKLSTPVSRTIATRSQSRVVPRCC